MCQCWKRADTADTARHSEYRYLPVFFNRTYGDVEALLHMCVTSAHMEVGDFNGGLYMR